MTRVPFMFHAGVFVSAIFLLLHIHHIGPPTDIASSGRARTITAAAMSTAPAIRPNATPSGRTSSTNTTSALPARDDGGRRQGGAPHDDPHGRPHDEVPGDERRGPELRSDTPVSAEPMQEDHRRRRRKHHPRHHRGPRPEE